jgi:hypothetical protein
MKHSARPHIVIEKQAETEVELFQNQTLRPILKLQNNLLLDFFKQQLLNKNIDLTLLSTEKVAELVHNSLHKDSAFRSLMLGLVCGHFTEQESQLYFQHKTELNKRTIAMMAERLCSNL